MNRPSPIEGSFFKAAWLKTFHNPPPCETLKTYIAVDVTVTDSAKADQMVIAVFALDPAYIFVLDLWRHQAGAATSVDVLLDMARDWKPIVIVTESGQLKNARFLFP